MNGVRRRISAAVAACTAGLALVITGSPAATADAGVATGKNCPAIKPAVQVGDAGVALEGAVVDRSGRLYVTDLFGGRILRFDAPGATPTVIATLPAGGGALALLNDGTLIVGTGADARVFLGDVLKPGQIHKVDIATGKLTTIASGLSAADGLAVAPDGTIYATNDFGGLIGRITPDGRVQADWAHFASANGAVLSPDGAYLYVSRTFSFPGVSRIPTANPAKPQSLLDLSGLHTFDAPDGLTLDSAGRPVVPTDINGDIWRLDGRNTTCTLASGLTLSSVIVYGRGRTGFAAGHLYRAGFDGKIYEIPSGFDAAAAAA